MIRFEAETLLDIRDRLVRALEDATAVEAQVPDPTLGAGLYGGEELVVDGRTVHHHGYRCWAELAELLGCRLVNPRPVADAPGFVQLRFERLERADSFHDDTPADHTEKYGITSHYARIDKREEPSIVLALEAAIQRVQLVPGARVLDLGVNTGDELWLLRRVVGAEVFAQLEILGLDHSPSAVARASERFGSADCRLLVHDLNDLATLALGRFDLLVSVGTLHSPGIQNSKALLMTLVQEHLTPSGAVLLGFPSCRWHDGEVSYGARAANYNYPEQSVVLKDVDWCKRYLQQHRFRVTITGRHYLFVTATRIGRSGS